MTRFGGVKLRNYDWWYELFIYKYTQVVNGCILYDIKRINGKKNEIRSIMKFQHLRADRQWWRQRKGPHILAPNQILRNFRDTSLQNL